MPKLSPEIELKIDDFRDQGYISRAETRILKAYFSGGTRTEVAQLLGIGINSLATNLTKLKKNKVLCKTENGRYQLAEDIESCEKEPPPPVVPVRKVAMTEAEREWMVENYKKYKNNRSEAARILNRSKFDLCRMAIELKMDQKN